MAILLYFLEILTVFVGICLAMPSVSEDSKILILGAGVSGISAAKTLDEAGYHNIVVIEGRSAVGGRMKSVKLSDYTIELGAHWLYGKGTNPIYKLLLENDISLAEDYEDTWAVLDTSGNDITHMADEAQLRFESVMEAVDSDGKNAIENNLSDFTMRSRLRYHGWKPKTLVEDVIDVVNIDFEIGASPEFASGKHAHLWAPYEAFESEDILPLNDTRGYKHLVEILAEPFLSTDQTKSRIVYNETVKQINQTTDGVEILTDSGTRYQGDYVIVTFSLGVLQSRAVTFSPALPACKQLAIDKMELALMTLIYLQFPMMFWNDTATILFASEQRGKNSVWVNMNFILPGSNILQLVVWGDESRRVERLEDQVVVDEILQYLSTMYPGHNIPQPINYTMSRWTYDPLYRGAYTYWPTGFTENNMADMIAPFGRVLFAGGHLDSVQYGFVHGAYTSGRKTANDLIRCLQYPGLCQQYDMEEFECSRMVNVIEEKGCVPSTGTTVGSTFLSVAFMAFFHLLGLQ